MKTFKIYWLDKKEEIIKGNTIGEAFMLAGYGGGALRAVDYYEEINDAKQAEESSFLKWWGAEYGGRIDNETMKLAFMEVAKKAWDAAISTVSKGDGHEDN